MRSPLSAIYTFPEGKVLKIFNSTGLVAVVKACSDKVDLLLHFQYAPGCVCERTGQAGTKNQLSQYHQNGKNKHFWVSFQLFFPYVCRLCRLTKLFSRKYFSICIFHISYKKCKLDNFCLPCINGGCCDKCWALPKSFGYQPKILMADFSDLL